MDNDKIEYCRICKKEGMVLKKNCKKCKECKLKQPLFNYTGIKEEYCKDCKKDGMVNIIWLKKKVVQEAKKMLNLI